MPTWIWEQADWPAFHWRETEISPLLARARLAQGRILGAAGLLDPALTLDADVSILVEDGVQTSAIEGERLDLDAVRSSVARHLGLPTAGLPAPSRAIDGLIDVLLDATRRFDAPLTLERLLGWQAALFPTGYSGLKAIRTGQLRGTEPMEVVSGGVGRERVHFLAPPRENRLLDAGPQGFIGGINNRKYMGLTRTSRATAWRELSDLVAKGCLVPTGKGGRSSAYEIPWADL